ncbi:MAG: extracellular solute-binding protein [Clostridiales bacterium]|nr:extracellular solute-binding protein [Clostridiales bacterium]
MKKLITMLLLLALLTTSLPAMADERSDALYKGIRGTTVTILFDSEPTTLQKKQIKAFELKYGCKVEPFIMAWNDWKNQMLSLVVSGEVPDVCYVPDETFLKWLSRGLLMELDDYVIADDPIWNQQIWDMFSWMGKHYGISSNGISPLYCIYNASMFYEKGVKTPLEYYEEGKWNFKNFRKCAIEMTGDGVVGAGIGWRYALNLANGNSPVELDRENGQILITMNNEPAIAAIELQAELLQGGYSNMDGWGVPFGNGQVAMVLERPVNVIGQFDLRTTTMANAEIEIVPLPMGPDNEEGLVPCIADAVAIPKNAKNPLGGMAWTYFLAEYNEKHKNDEDVVANRRKTYTDEQWEFIQEYEEDATFINTFVYGVGDWYLGDWNYWTEMIYNGLTPQAAYAKYESEFQYWIDGMFLE